MAERDGRKYRKVHLSASVMGCDPNVCNDSAHFYEECAGEPAAPAAPEQPVLDNNRCALCGWLLAEAVDKGCVRGNCSQRPLPDNFYDPIRAWKEGGYPSIKITKPEHLKAIAPAPPAPAAPALNLTQQAHLFIDRYKIPETQAEWEEDLVEFGEGVAAVMRTELALAEQELKTLREALRMLFDAVRNEMVNDQLILEWKKDSPMGIAEAVLAKGNE